jgi:hypothetical protein
MNAFVRHHQSLIHFAYSCFEQNLNFSPDRELHTGSCKSANKI